MRHTHQDGPRGARCTYAMPVHVHTRTRVLSRTRSQAHVCTCAQVVHDSPRVRLLHHFVTAHEAEHLIKIATPGTPTPIEHTACTRITQVRASACPRSHARARPHPARLPPLVHCACWLGR